MEDFSPFSPNIFAVCDDLFKVESDKCAAKLWTHHEIWQKFGENGENLQFLVLFKWPLLEPKMFIVHNICYLVTLTHHVFEHTMVQTYFAFGLTLDTNYVPMMSRVLIPNFYSYDFKLIMKSFLTLNQVWATTFCPQILGFFLGFPF